MHFEFDKMEGAGNDFILVDNRLGVIPDAEKRSLVVDCCRRAFGIGADGMIFVENDPDFDFCWDFYNSDGSSAEMCGNGARCVARFANRIGAAGETMTFRSLAGPIQAELTPRGAKVRLTDAVMPSDAASIDVDNAAVSLWFVNTGVPHAVVMVDDIDAVDIAGMGRAIRRHPHFAPSGTNVNFFQMDGKDKVRIRTYERGVEDETLACGTGSVATSLVAGKFLGAASPVTATTRGGGDLVVHFTFAGNKAESVFLEGGARKVFSGIYESD